MTEVAAGARAAVAAYAEGVGLLRVVQGQRPKATWRTVLAIEEWLVGSDRDAAADRVAALTESPLGI